MATAPPDSVSRVTAGTAGAPSAPAAARLTALLAAAHGPPALAVTVLAGLLSVAAGHSSPTTLLVVAAVLTGQLSIGWSNDLVDLGRDRRRRAHRQAAGHRRAAGGVGAHGVRPRRRRDRAAGAGVRPGPASCTWPAWPRAGPTTSGSTATGWSWLPYAVCVRRAARLRVAGWPDGGGPALVVAGRRRPARCRRAPAQRAARTSPTTPRPASAGFPHRLGSRWIPGVAAVVLLGASAAILLGAGAPVALGLVTAVVAARHWPPWS